MKMFAKLKRVLACLLAVAMLTACEGVGVIPSSSSKTTNSDTSNDSTSDGSSESSSSSDRTYTFTINLYVTPLGGGTVTGAGTYTYTSSEPTSVTLKAIPNEGYRFVGWKSENGEIKYCGMNDTFTWNSGWGSSLTRTAVFEKIRNSADLPTVTEFVLTDTDGNQFTIGDLSGKPVVLIFGRMGEITCGLTYSSITALNSLLPSLNDKSLEVYFLDINADNTKEAILKKMSSFPNISVCYQDGGYNSEEWNLYRRYFSSGDSVWDSDSGYRSLPLVYFISRDGKICDHTENSLDTNVWRERLQSNFGISS